LLSLDPCFLNPLPLPLRQGGPIPGRRFPGEVILSSPKYGNTSKGRLGLMPGFFFPLPHAGSLRSTPTWWLLKIVILFRKSYEVAPYGFESSSVLSDRALRNLGSTFEKSNFSSLVRRLFLSSRAPRTECFRPVGPFCGARSLAEQIPSGVIVIDCLVTPLPFPRAFSPSKPGAVKVSKDPFLRLSTLVSCSKIFFLFLLGSRGWVSQATIAK